MMALINKPLAFVLSDILMLFDWELEDVSLHDNDLVVKVQIYNAKVSWVLVDNRSGVNIIFKDVAEKMAILDNINKGKTTIHSFNMALVWSLSTVKVAI